LSSSTASASTSLAPPASRAVDAVLSPRSGKTFAGASSSAASALSLANSVTNVDRLATSSGWVRANRSGRSDSPAAELGIGRQRGSEGDISRPSSMLKAKSFSGNKHSARGSIGSALATAARRLFSDSGAADDDDDDDDDDDNDNDKDNDDVNDSDDDDNDDDDSDDDSDDSDDTDSDDDDDAAAPTTAMLNKSDKSASTSSQTSGSLRGVQKVSFGGEVAVEDDDDPSKRRRSVKPVYSRSKTSKGGMEYDHGAPVEKTGVPLPEHVVKEVVDALRANTVRKLALSDRGCRDLSSFASLIADSKSLHTIALDRNKVDDDSLKLLAHALEKNQSVVELYLSYNNVTDFGMLFLCRSLKLNTKLQLLDVSVNLLNDIGATMCGELLRTPSSQLRYLFLGYNHIGRGISYVAEALAVNRTLVVLDLQYSHIANPGAIALGLALCDNKTLRSLDVSYCRITSRGARALATMLTGNSTLLRLTLDRNALGANGGTVFGESLRSNRGLQVLSLSGCGIDDSSAEALAAALPHNQSLLELCLSRNPIGPDGAKAFADVLASPGGTQQVLSHLIVLNLSLCPLLGHGVAALATCFPIAVRDATLGAPLGTDGEPQFVPSNRLRRLGLMACRAGDEGTLALADGLKRACLFDDLDLKFNGITDVGGRALIDALDANPPLCTGSLYRARRLQHGHGAALAHGHQREDAARRTLPTSCSASRSACAARVCWRAIRRPSAPTPFPFIMLRNSFYDPVASKTESALPARTTVEPGAAKSLPRTRREQTAVPIVVDGPEDTPARKLIVSPNRVPRAAPTTLAAASALVDKVLSTPTDAMSDAVMTTPGTVAPLPSRPLSSLHDSAQFVTPNVSPRRSSIVIETVAKSEKD
jgi:Ran GTPase-activating protein (RanGAP) involved in mRNA processing and transport